MRIAKGSKFIHWLYILLVWVIFTLGYVNRSIFEMVCVICAALYWVVQLRLSFALDKDENAQRKFCKPVGFFLLLPSIGMIAAGIWIIFHPYMSISPQMPYCVIALSAVLFASLLFQILAIRKNNSLAGGFLRLVVAASMSAPLSLIVVLAMHITQSDETALICMSIEIFGVLSFLIAANMIMVSICGYKSTRDSLKAISDLIKSKKLIFMRASILKDVFLVAGKSIISILSFSFFMFANALYSTGMGIARYIAIKMHTQGGEKQIQSYRVVGIIISAASICYVLYSVRLFFGGRTNMYDMNVALAIALYTFVEFGINIREAIRLHKSKALEAKALRAIGMSSTLLCFVLTQVAIMSFAAEGDNSFFNALSGVVFGGLAALVGLYVVIDSFRHQKESAL